MSTLNFKDKVVVITGAGGGLGRVYALEYAKRGAKVVVNDLGGSLGGAGHNHKAADVVVDEIRKAGGTAVANYDSVEFGDKIIKTAIDNFGTVHIIINNAGILRDSTFAKMEEKDFQLVYDVHLNGAYKLTRAAWPYFKEQKFGRVVNTASPAGLFGNFGQANYSAAKLGLVGFAETLAKEGYKYNINVNAIAPLAKSRMTEKLLPPDILAKLGPEKIAPLILFLTHADSKVTNSIFEVAAGFYGQIRWERSSGSLFRPDDSFTPEAILNQLDGVFNFKDSSFNKVSYPIGISDYNDLYAKATKLPSNDQGSKKVSLKDKVVVITGAGAGLGRAHARLFAKYGAKVVINDIKNPYDAVDEIKKAGGEAVGDKHDVVAEADKVIQTALDAYGRVDVLVNNAGILRDRSFQKMTDEEWFAVQKVHMLSTYRLSKLVWPLFAKQKSGVIINTTSTSGIYGNFGQANYAAAKAAILGFSRTLAIEGKKQGIRVNIIAPHAETAMTKTIFSANEMNKFDASQVSPMLVLLASDATKITGELFEVGGGWVGNTRWQRAKGAVSHDTITTPEFIRDHWKEVTDFSQPITVRSTQESSMAILQAVSPAEEDDDDDEDDEDDTPKQAASDGSYAYTHRDVALYNLGLGAKASELKYTFEGADDFQVIPSYGVIPAMSFGDDNDSTKLLENFNPALLLHGEQYLKIAKYPIPTEATVKTKTFPVQVANKGSKAAVLVSGSSTVDASSGEELFYNEATVFVKGAKTKDQAFTKRRAFATDNHTPPKRAPDFEVEIQTSEDQAAIYRLSGDYNPLHIDPAFAAIGKFPKPILHGLCTFGVSVKALYEKFGNIAEVKVRFSNVVFPGDKLKVVAWKEGDKIVFQTWNVSRKVVSISNAAIKLASSKSKL